MEVLFLKTLWTITLSWISLLAFDVGLDITVKGEDHLIKTIGSFLVVLSCIGWVGYGIYSFWLWV